MSDSPTPTPRRTSKRRYPSWTSSFAAYEGTRFQPGCRFIVGTFTVRIEIGDLSNSHFAHTEAMVDTGAVYTMVPEDLIAGLTLISPETREFVLTDESKVEYTVGYLRIRFEEKEVFALTIVAPEGTMPLLGVTALENALLAVDPYNERLVPIAGSLRTASFG